jgi:hypothetical protein
MPGLVPGIHVISFRGGEDVAGRNKPAMTAERSLYVPRPYTLKTVSPRIRSTRKITIKT